MVLVQLFATLWTVALQAPLSMGFSRQEYWSGLPFPSPGDLPDPGIRLRCPALQVDSLPLNHQGNTLTIFPPQIPPMVGCCHFVLSTWFSLHVC